MVEIGIDASGLVESSLITEGHVSEMMDFVVKEVTMSFAREWQDLALSELKGTGADYAKALVFNDEGPSRGSVTLTNWLPNALESGLPAFDMKPGLLGGPNAKVSVVKGKGGAPDSTVSYNTVPLRLGTPGAVSTGSLFSSIMPAEVYRAVTSKPQASPGGGLGKRSEGLKREEIPERYREPALRKAPPGSRFNDYKHKVSVFQGISRRNDPVTGQNIYRTFRRVSDNSDPDSWVHPGFTARHFAEKSLESMGMERIVGVAVDNYLSRIASGG